MVVTIDSFDASISIAPEIPRYLRRPGQPEAALPALYRTSMSYPRAMLRALCIIAACGFSRALAPPRVSLGDFLVQRAIQQQLYFSADLRNEPMVGWLKHFQGHEHLDSCARGEGTAGFPGTYSASFSQLKTTPYPEYLSAFSTEPETTIEVKIVKPAKRLSARERANPFLAKQGPTFEIYNQPIVPKNILTQVLQTANALVETWDFHLGEAEDGDMARVASDRAAIKVLPTSEMLVAAQLAEGGETSYNQYTQDEPLPLYGFDIRACDRLTTLRALSMLVAEIDALTPETAFEAGYLRRDAPADDEHDKDDVDELVVKRRRLRRQKREEAFVTGDDLAKATAALEAARAFLAEFCATWGPRLSKGDPRSDLQKKEVRPSPGMKELRPADAGVDAAVALEELWAYQGEAAYGGVRGGELVVPALMGVRLRELRSAAAAEARAELQDEIRPELVSARLKYTDYTEEEAQVDSRSMAERFLAASDEENYV